MFVLNYTGLFHSNVTGRTWTSHNQRWFTEAEAETAEAIAKDMIANPDRDADVGDKHPEPGHVKFLHVVLIHHGSGKTRAKRELHSDPRTGKPLSGKPVKVPLWDGATVVLTDKPAKVAAPRKPRTARKTVPAVRPGQIAASVAEPIVPERHSLTAVNDLIPV